MTSRQFHKASHLPSAQLPSYLSHDAIDFITKALRRVPEERPSIEELMKHPFITHHADSTRELMQLEAVMEQQALREEAAQQVSADRSSLKQSSTRARRPRKQNSGQAAPFPLPPGLRASIELGSSDDEGNGGLGGLLRRHQKKAFEVPAKERRRLVEAIRERQLQLSLAWFLRELDAITNKERKSRRGRDVNLLCFKRGGGVKEPGGEAPEATEAATAPEQV